LSTLALEGSSGGGATSRLLLAVRFADLAALGLALPVFLLADASMLGYAVGAAAWIAQRTIQLLAVRRVARSLAAGVRRTALGTLAAATLARLWLVSLAILLVGLSERRAGLAAAILVAVLVTFYLGGEALRRLATRSKAER
jgi:hypothetical protein